MDWDDEDEKTTLYDKSAKEDASRDLLRSAPPPPLPAAGAPARALAGASGGAAPAMPRPPAPAPLPAPAYVPQSVPARGAGGSKVLIALITLAAVALAAVAAYLLLVPKLGSITVTVAGPNDEPVERVEVLVDQKVVCTSSPCRVDKVAAGTHIVSVNAEGYKKTADKAITVDKGQNVVLPVTLASRAHGTGVRVAVAGNPTGLRLSVNGNDEGPLPVELKEMTPGQYTIRISGSDRYEPHEQKVEVEAEKIQSVEPKLKVIKGLAHIKPGTGSDGARILLVSGQERRPLPKLPIKIDIKPDKTYTLVATRKGYQDWEQTISFDDGIAEKTFEIAMTPEGGAEAAAPAGGGGRLRSAGAKPSDDQPKPVAGGGSGAATGHGTLNINSIPASNVILDGRPLGQTPKIGVSVPAGPHTIMFVHPEFGRKVQSVNVAAGGTSTAAVRFP